jgi:hypothetical protein
MKVSFGLGLGIGLSVLAALPAPGNAQCFAAPRRYASQAYYPPVQYQYAQPGQVTYPAQPMPQVTQGQFIQGQPQVFQSQPAPLNQPATTTSYYRPPVEGTAAGDVRHTLHRLWDDHVILTRLFLVSALADLPDKGAASDRLTKNQADIGAAVKPTLGEAAGEKLTGLLKNHVLIAADVIAAAKANDATKKGEAVTKLQANADEIATFLTGANPQAWPDQVVKGMLREHIDLLAAVVDARAKQDWQAEAAAFDKSRTQIRHMADLLANGLGATPVAYPGQVQYPTPTRRIIRR